MKVKIIILSILLIAISSYSYARCYYYPGCGISIAEYMSGKCPPAQMQTMAAHKPEQPEKKWTGYGPTGTSNYSSRYTSRRQNNALTSKGYYIGVVKQRQSDGSTLYRWKLNLPCFYSVPGNTPCDRGRFRR